MAIVAGAQPGGRNGFAVCALYYDKTLPLTVLHARSYSGVDDVLRDIMGLCGEWGTLHRVAVAAPLTWSGSPSGWRRCDRTMRAQLPAWAPVGWLRAPNALPGAVSVQGPALTWALAREAQAGHIEVKGVVETAPRVSLAHIASDLPEAVVDYRRHDATRAVRLEHVRMLMERLQDSGIVRATPQSMPRTPDELDALVAALAAMGLAAPDAGLVVQELAGGDIRPVGKRAVALLRALP